MRDEYLDLLLAHADGLEPVLADGLPRDTVERAPRPKKTPRQDDAILRHMIDRNPNDLPINRWGVVAPQGPDGDRLLEVMKPLIQWRENEQGAECIVFRAPPGLDARGAVDWKIKVYESEEISEEDLPQYLMLLGDFEQVSLELQNSFAQRAYAGRVYFANSPGNADLDAHARYVEKVLRHARGASSETLADVIVYVSQDGTNATQHEEAEGFESGLEMLEKSRDKGRLPIADLREIRGKDGQEFLGAGTTQRPSVLHSISHGLGAPRAGWTSENEQWARQGALVLGPTDVFDAEQIGRQTFLPGGVWFMQSSFSAGMAATSLYHAWLTSLIKEEKHRSRAEALLASLPSGTQRPFIAALPQAALANPNGPLAIIGQVDLAWSYSMSNSSSSSRENYKLQKMRTVASIARGDRVARGFNELINTYQVINFELMSTYEMEEDARMRGCEVPSMPNRGGLWMARNDWKSHVLLGDPAVRLPLSQKR